MTTDHADHPILDSAPAAGDSMPVALVDAFDANALPPVHRLPVVAVPDNPVLTGLVQRLVEQKDQLDCLARDPRLAGLLPSVWLGQGGRALDIGTFVQSVLPFLQPGERGETAPVRLPLRHVLGDAGRWTKADVTEPRSLAWFLASDERATAGAKDAAEACLVGALGLAWMHEGRTRAGFLRAMEVPTLAARVSMLGYPAATDLALFQVTVHGQSQVWCVHGRRRLQPLLSPWITVPLLAAYGVAAPQPWPAGYPGVDAVEQALARARPGRALPEVDLMKVARALAEEAAADTWQPVSLLQLRTWQPRWGFFLATFVALPSALLVTAALALPGAIEAASVAASLGFAAGAVGALAAPWIFAQRRHLS